MVGILNSLGIFAPYIGNIIALIISGAKSTLFWGGDALICGIGNWIANAFTGLLGAAGFGAGGLGTMVGASGWLPALIGAISGVGGGILNGIANVVSYLWPLVTSAIAAVIGLIPFI